LSPLETASPVASTAAVTTGRGDDPTGRQSAGVELSEQHLVDFAECRRLAPAPARTDS
jgi:hypothetical protein